MRYQDKCRIHRNAVSTEIHQFTIILYSVHIRSHRYVDIDLLRDMCVDDTLNWLNIDDTLDIPNCMLHFIVSRVNIGKLNFSFEICWPSEAFYRCTTVYENSMLVQILFTFFSPKAKSSNFRHVDRASSIFLKK